MKEFDWSEWVLGAFFLLVIGGFAWLIVTSIGDCDRCEMYGKYPMSEVPANCIRCLSPAPTVVYH